MRIAFEGAGTTAHRLKRLNCCEANGSARQSDVGRDTLAALAVGYWVRKARQSRLVLAQQLVDSDATSVAHERVCRA